MARWNEYVENLKLFEEATRRDQTEHKKSMRAKIDAATKTFSELVLPIRNFEATTGILPWITECTKEWQLKASLSSVSMVYILDLTKSGYSFSSVASAATRVISDAIAAAPATTCAIVIAPNRGAFGGGDDDAAIEKAHDDVEGLLKRSDLMLKVKRGNILFDTEWVSANPSQHVSHPIWLVCTEQVETTTVAAGASDKEKQTFNSVCKFVKSALFKQGGISAVVPKKLADHVNPFSVVGMSDSSHASLRRKQVVSGEALFLKFSTAIMHGTKFAPRDGVCFVDLFPFDGSASLATIRNHCDLPGTAPKFMVVSPVWSVGDVQPPESNKKRLYKWLEGAHEQVTKKAIKEKSLKIEGLDVIDYESTKERPNYDVSKFEITFPTGNHLPVKQSTLDEWGAKFSKQLSVFQAIIQGHDDVWNPTRVPFKEGGKRSAAKDDDVDAEQAIGPDHCRLHLSSESRPGGKFFARRF